MVAILRHFLGRLVKFGRLNVEPFHGAAFQVGDGKGPSCAIRFTDAGAAFAFMRDPELAAGELYMDGRLEVERGDIYDFLALAAINTIDYKPPLWIDFLRKLRRRAVWLGPGNRPNSARKNVAHHYDLDQRLYRLFLDQDLQYSCAYFETPEMGLDAAQLAKKRHIAAKLAIEPGQKVLDIGCGWGGAALYLASVCGAEVLGVTLSREQLGVARKRAQDAGLAGRARFALEDYRQTKGRFDRIVSIGMFEHVGPQYYDEFFARIAGLLEENGVALVHTIVHFRQPGPPGPWIEKYIFPGGYIPALSEITPSVEHAGLIVADVEILRQHYALTLAHWRKRFKRRRDEARALYGERFCRMWEFYLAGSEISFRLQGQCVAQIQLVKRLDALPITRNYIAEREAALRIRESEARSASPETAATDK